MQSGAFNNIVRCMIEMGIPRETALFLFEKIFAEEDNKEGSKIELERMIREMVQKKYNELPYWIQVQLDFIV